MNDGRVLYLAHLFFLNLEFNKLAKELLDEVDHIGSAG